MSRFMFSTGIENSSPTIENGRKRIDEMSVCKHYDFWREDFALVQEDLRVRTLRYGVPLYKTFLGPGRFDWEFTDMAFRDLKTRKIIPIADLCHFGVPDWVGDFQNPDFPELFASYARAFAERFPWVQLYTPVNEMYVCATYSAAYGWWNEQLRSDKGFVTALKHIVKANILGMHEILSVRPDAIFVQSESSEYNHADNPKAIAPAEYLNERRFLSLDLNYGNRVNSQMYRFLRDNGMTDKEYDFFMREHLKSHCIMGNDYYERNEHSVNEDGAIASSGEIFGYNEITRQYYERYRLPVMHTETNTCEGPKGDEAVKWLRKEWANVLRVRNSGVPIVGFTWYSLTDQVDWDSALREDSGHINPLGLYDLDRKPRPVGTAYKQLIKDWREVLPAQSVCLTVPLAEYVPPAQNSGDNDDSETQEQSEGT
ncbi:family 1 glycosylhydrolase [Methylocystis sp. IM3]|uniref:family 1 glycosylhydrolase n=1 Tax=unclassified Methylocystis TaxID=2625913 RepID=UPI0030FCDC4E